jgi:hypothetical protein
LNARSRADFAVWLKRRLEADRGPTRAELSEWFITDGPNGVEPTADVLDYEHRRAVGLIRTSGLAKEFARLEDIARRQLRELLSSVARVLQMYEMDMLRSEPDFEQVLAALQRALLGYKPRLARELPTLDEWIADAMKPNFADRWREFVQSCAPMHDAIAIKLAELDAQCARRGARPKSEEDYAADKRAIELAVTAGASKTEAEAVLGVADKLKKRRRRSGKRRRRHGGQIP